MYFNVYASKGIILKTQDVGETDKIINIITSDLGKIKLIAKGVRRIKSRRRGHLEVFSKINFTARKGKNHIDNLSEASLIDYYQDIRSSLVKTALAYYFVEVIDKSLKEGEINENPYEILGDFLYKLTQNKATKAMRQEFLRVLFEKLGYLNPGQSIDIDKQVDIILERHINTKRVGKRLLE